MKIAHIVPPYVAHLMKEHMGDYHLLLPKLVPLERYREYYRGDVGFKIMDNGVAEYIRVDFTTQLYMARALGCGEVVLPDVLGSMDKTLRAIADAFPTAFGERSNYQFMMVVQGTTVLECVNCAERALNMFPGIINTFGIPRHILATTGDARVRLVHILRNLSPNRDIHLLGTHSHFPRELIDFGEFYRRAGIRGVDTSLAWNATLQDVCLDAEGLRHNIAIPRQPMEEFAEAIPTQPQLELLSQNLEIMNAWA